ncbi:8-oxo-dGTP diphosphatase [Haloferula luteola]|uniref:8-oxo-dGTP diphosphatase n=1 Tax=Haloferula luteola TaxID=595692 RepID=A0A840VDF8_9BACT|nr:(deoxy)nucleoside triphosphate pyrophosphohydrolase [Haloferula luteola]MBB5353544.1 8-oxo-dGTP diphosphatase [Haloferula luteola]
MLLHVVAGLIQDDTGRLLACQRPAGKHLAGKWEFPGGKVEEGESIDAALVRELDEELGIQVAPGASLTPVDHDYGRGPIRLIPMLCQVISGTPVAREHEALRWCSVAELESLEWAEADLPILAEWCALRRSRGEETA